jgi:ATP-dependent Clp protease ATP-binding subunit ClpC
MNREIYPKVKKIISEASKEAKGFDDINIKPEHLILSIINDNDNDCVYILKKMNVNVLELYDFIGDHIRKSDLTPRILPIRRKTLPFSDDTKMIIKNLDLECEKLNDLLIDVPHIFLAILNTNIGCAEIMKTEFNITYKEFKKQILNMRQDYSKNMYDNDEPEEQDSFKKKPKTGDVKSKTPVLDNFCRDISKAVERGDIDPVVGRSVEIKRVTQILSRRKKNNPVLIGDPGVGKTSIVEGLAQLIYDGNAPRPLMNKRIMVLDLASLVAGTKYRGQFEERMKAVLEECISNKDIILFIDELHTIVGAGNASGSLDASNIFKPALARGEIQIIGATTLDEYRENIEKDGALTRRFQQVLVDEPTLEETKVILMNIKEKYEKHHKVTYTEEAIDECVKLSARYITERAMPDKAIDVLDEAGATTNVTLEKPESIKLLEEKKTKLNEKKKEVVAKQKYEEAAKIRDEEKEINSELSLEINKWNESLNNKSTVVGVELISEIVSMMTGIPLSKISTQESKKLMNLDKELTGKVIGQDDAVNKVVKAIKRNRIGIKDKNKPVGSFIFLGPTGVGKCICGDTEITVRNKVSGEVKTINIKNIIPDTN